MKFFLLLISFGCWLCGFAQSSSEQQEKSKDLQSKKINQASHYEKNRGMERGGNLHRGGFMPMDNRLACFDADEDGLISEEEGENFKKQIVEEMKKDFDKFRIRYNQMMLERFDKNKDGKLDKKELEYVRIVLDRLSQRKLKNKQDDVRKKEFPQNIDKERLEFLLNKCKKNPRDLTIQEKKELCIMLDIRIHQEGLPPRLIDKD